MQFTPTARPSRPAPTPFKLDAINRVETTPTLAPTFTAVPTLQPTSTPSPEPVQHQVITYEIVKDYQNLRTCPRFDCRSVAQPVRGSQFVVAGNSGDWVLLVTERGLFWAYWRIGWLSDYDLVAKSVTDTQ